MPEGAWWPICMDCGEDIERKLVDWFRQKHNKLPNRCIQCALDAVREILYGDA